MTTGLVAGITDELVAELEAVAHTGKGAFMIECAEVHALLTERAELMRDAGRYRWLREQNAKPPEECSEINDFAVVIDGPDGGSWIGSNLDAAIDAAMQESKP